MSLVDAASIPDGSVLRADVCIVGAGPAGLALALELDAAGVRTLLLESGGLSFEAGAHDLGDFESSGEPLRAAQPVRQRQFGGTTSTWHGRLAPLDAIDFERRAWVPWSGWPLAASEVASLAPRAARFFEVRHIEAFEPGFWADDPTFNRLASPALSPAVHLWPRRRRMGKVHLPRLRRSPHVEVVLHAQVRRLLGGGDVSSAVVGGLGGNAFTAMAPFYVLACGGLENARVLLLSVDGDGRALGNRHDTVGRYYMNHARGEGVARLRPFAAPQRRDSLWLDLTEHRARRTGGRVQFAVRPAVELQRREELLNACSFFYLVAPPRIGRLSEAVRRMREGARSPRGLADARLVASELPLLARLAALRLARGTPPIDHLLVIDQVEQVPDRESRITLDERRDRFGDPLLRLHWVIGPETRRTHRRLHEVLGAHVAAAGIGTLESALLDDPGYEPPYTDASHPIGATRMSDDPRTGVVDADCRVHGVANLYLAGSSVFPTSGQAPPTWTVVCLALRLADHLRHRLRRGGEGPSTTSETSRGR